MSSAALSVLSAPAMLRPKYTALWFLWLLMFAAIEGGALVDKRPGDTLSEHVRRWASVGTKSRGWRLRRLALLAGLVALAAHFLTGGTPIDADGDGFVEDFEPGFV